MATRCCCPPESVDMRRSANGAAPTAARGSPSTRSRSSALAGPRPQRAPVSPRRDEVAAAHRVADGGGVVLGHVADARVAPAGLSPEHRRPARSTAAAARGRPAAGWSCPSRWARSRRRRRRRDRERPLRPDRPAVPRPRRRPSRTETRGSAVVPASSPPRAARPAPAAGRPATSTKTSPRRHGLGDLDDRHAGCSADAAELRRDRALGLGVVDRARRPRRAAEQLLERRSRRRARARTRWRPRLLVARGGVRSSRPTARRHVVEHRLGGGVRCPCRGLHRGDLVDVGPPRPTSSGAAVGRGSVHARRAQRRPSSAVTASATPRHVGRAVPDVGVVALLEPDDLARVDDRRRGDERVDRLARPLVVAEPVHRRRGRLD